jgi:hypothetical protein
MADAVGEQRRRLAHPARHASGGVEDRVPGAVAEALEVAGGAIAVPGLELRIEPGIGLSTVEERHLVPALQGRFDQVAPDEEGPAEDEDPHLITSPFTRHS